MSKQNIKSATSLSHIPDRKKNVGRHDIHKETEDDKQGETSAAKKPSEEKDKADIKDKGKDKDKDKDKAKNKSRNSKPHENSQVIKNEPSNTAVHKIHPWSFLFISSSKNDLLPVTLPNENLINSTNKQLCKNLSTNEEQPSAKPPIKPIPRYENLTFPSGPCCRICHSGVSRERLISPCLCKGSLGHVHRSCLEQWLNQAGRSSCELCYHQFAAVESPRYGCCESAHVWLQHPRHRSHVQADFLICALLTVVTAGLMTVCLLGMRYFVIEGLKLGITHTWTHGAITVFLTLVILGYIVTLYLLVRDQVMPWYRWWQTAVTVRLVLEPLEIQQTIV